MVRRSAAMSSAGRALHFARTVMASGLSFARMNRSPGLPGRSSVSTSYSGMSERVMSLVSNHGEKSKPLYITRTPPALALCA